MYLITAYFDEQTNKALGRLIERIGEETGNDFMLANHVPPHLTISLVEAREETSMINIMERLKNQWDVGAIDLVSVGLLLPQVIYVTPVLNQYLQNLSEMVHREILSEQATGAGIKINRFYQPMQWLPHVTLGKRMDKEQLKKAVEISMDYFQPVSGKVVELGLAKTNPHREISSIAYLYR